MIQKQKSKNLVEYDGDDQVLSSEEIALRLKEQPEFIINARSNIPTLDAAMDGFREGELIVISGPTKQGKTLLAQSLTVAFHKQQYYPLWFSFEVPIRQFLNQFHVLPLIYMPAKLKPHALEWFKDRVQESFEKYHTRIIFCDHLHYLIDLARLRNPSIEIGQIIRTLKTLAVEGNFIVFLLCHTAKGSNEDSLSYEAIRDSSFISQESDSVIMIKRREDLGENRAKARVEFHRRTGIIEKEIQLIKVNGYLAEYTEVKDERTRSYQND